MPNSLAGVSIPALKLLVWLWIIVPTWPCLASGTGLASPASENFAVLVFTKTGGFRHDSIAAGIASITSLGKDNGFTAISTEDNTVFTDENLVKYRVIVFLNTTGHILDSDQRASFERFIRNGGGFVGIHSATDTEYEWPWYGNLVGTYFDSHPSIQPATVEVVDSSHPSTRRLPREWQRTDEWYNFREDPSTRVKVLLRVDEKTYSGGAMGDRHPLSWYHEYDGGRAWYTAMGHTIESYSEPLFLAHILGGIMWAANVAVSDVEQGKVRSGYLIVTPDANSETPKAALRFGLLSNRVVQSEAGVIGRAMTDDASTFAEVVPASSLNVGIAVANPGDHANSVTITLRHPDGSVAGMPISISLESRHQIAKFLTEVLPDALGAGFMGSLRVQSSEPVSVLGLGFSGTVISAAPITARGRTADIPLRTLMAGSLPSIPAAGVVGGSNASIFPQIAIGGGWATEVALVNYSVRPISGRLDVFDPAGNPMAVEFNNLYQSTFPYSIPAAGTFLFAPRDEEGRPIF
jgi:type 1 glutamine amidotransferase